LTVPELVPFRLTQNVVDGLGTTGTSGLFTTASEAILSVLRQNAPALLTILSAVVSDPLYSWSMSPVKARERQALANADEGDNDDDQGGLRKDQGLASAAAGAASEVESGDSAATAADDDDQNESAATAIAKIKEKLQGYEDGTSGEQQSVQSQVQLLINSARDPDKLCVMFHGWSSWV
jgi:serine-protein kinase ATM